MTEEQTARNQAIQAVVDRVSSYQDGAPQGTVTEELTRGFDEAGVDVTADQIDELARAIEAEDGDVDATSVIGS